VKHQHIAGISPSSKWWNGIFEALAMLAPQKRVRGQALVPLARSGGRLFSNPRRKALRGQGAICREQRAKAALFCGMQDNAFVCDTQANQRFPVMVF
jgi:hypothetical protein